MSRTTYKHIRHKQKSAQFLKQTIVNHWLIYLLCLILLFGILWGVLYTSSASGQSFGYLQFLFNIHNTSIMEKSAVSIFTASFSSGFIVLFILFVLGFCAIGIPAILFMVLLQGFGFGLSAGYIYATVGTKGILYNICVFIPCMALLFFVILHASKSAASMSISLFRLVFAFSDNDKVQVNVNEYFIKFILFILFIFAKALLETILVLLFSGLLK